MGKTVRIALPVPIKDHGETHTHIVMREPTYDEYVSCGGEPYSVGQSEDGILFTVEKADVIWAYASACIVSPGQMMLESLDWRVAREVRKAILGFFQAPAVADELSPTSPTTSSSS